MDRKIFDASGWFVINNVVFDEVMSELSASAFKVLCVVVRQTWGRAADDPGQGREAAQISYNQFMEEAGIGSRNTVHKAINECLESGYLVRHKVRKGKKPGFAYSLWLENAEASNG